MTLILKIVYGQLAFHFRYKPTSTESTTDFIRGPSFSSNIQLNGLHRSQYNTVDLSCTNYTGQSNYFRFKSVTCHGVSITGKLAGKTWGPQPLDIVSLELADI